MPMGGALVHTIALNPDESGFLGFRNRGPPPLPPSFPFDAVGAWGCE